MTGQDVINAVSIDMRRMIGTSGTDATLILGWVDRVQKDILQTSPIYNNLMTSVVQVTTQEGVYSYTLPGVTARKITMVYDRSSDRPLLPIDLLSAPLPLNDPSTSTPETTLSRFVQAPSKVAINATTNSVRPEYYNFVNSTTMSIFPAPANASNAGTLDVYVETRVATLTDPSATLTLTDDGMPAIIAGTNVFACLYLKRSDEAQTWQQIYGSLKVGESS